MEFIKRWIGNLIWNFERCVKGMPDGDLFASSRGLVCAILVCRSVVKVRELNFVCVNGPLHKQAEPQPGGRGLESPPRSTFGCGLKTRLWHGLKGRDSDDWRQSW